LYLIKEAHTSKVARHFGVGKIVANLYMYVYWPRMQEDVDQFIKVCILCCYNNHCNINKGLYNPLLVLTRPWERISMDFMGGFPIIRKGYHYLFVIVDRFNKVWILMPCKKTIKGQDVMNMLFKKVWVHFFIPRRIILDVDSGFLSAFWTTLW
jgi:hypothetical protein